MRGTTSSWLGLILGTKARKIEVSNPRRKDILRRLDAAAEAVEADAGLPAFEGSRVSPAPTKALTGHETDALLPKCRVIIGVEAGEIECPVYGE